MDEFRQVQSHQLSRAEDSSVRSSAVDISIQLNNTTDVAYLVKEGGTQSRSLQELAEEIINLAY